ncbi:MAG: hypothetical protein KIT14_20480 [bacterium]|nr:hypothetical protein [bacterium]
MDAHREPAGARRRRQRGESGTRARRRVGDGGDAQREETPHRRVETGGEHGVGQRAHQMRERRLVADDEPVGRRRDAGRQPPQGTRAQHRRVPAAMPQPHRPAARDGGELVRTRQPPRARFVEALRPHPGPARQRPGVRAHRTQHRRGRVARAEIEVRVAHRQREQVQVRIDEAGKEHPAAAVDVLGTRTERPHDLGAIPDRAHAARRHADRARRRLARIERAHARVLEDQRHRLRRAGPR